MSAYVYSVLAFVAGYLLRWQRDRRIAKQIDSAIQEIRSTLGGDA